MAYERQYYTNGDVLDARQLNHMETGIKENSDNIGKLSKDITTKASAIKEKASGELIVVTDSDEAKPLGLAIDGKSEQNGEPTPDNPQEIRNIGVYDEASGKYAVEVKCTGKNLLKLKFKRTSTSGGITFTVDDNAIEYNGTKTNTSYVVLNSGSGEANINKYATPLFVVEQKLIGNSNDQMVIGARLTNGKYVNNIDNCSIGDEIGLIYVECMATTGTTVSGTFYPMVRLSTVTDDTYEPYKETTATVYLDEPLSGIEEYEDCFCNQNGVWGVLRRIALVDNNKWENVYVNSSTLGHRYGNVLSDMLIQRDIRVLCSHYSFKTNVGSFNVEGDYISTDEANAIIRRINIRTLEKDFATAEEFKAFMIENNVKTYYILAEPIFEPLAEQTVFDGFSMFYPTTILSNDCNANMEVTYIADTKAYIDKKFAELATAMV